jgi:hypothetical protein
MRCEFSPRSLQTKKEIARVLPLRHIERGMDNQKSLEGPDSKQTKGANTASPSLGEDFCPNPARARTGRRNCDDVVDGLIENSSMSICQWMRNSVARPPTLRGNGLCGK